MPQRVLGHVERRVPEVLVVLGDSMVPEDEESPRSPRAAPHRRENTHALAVFQQPDLGRLEWHNEKGPGYRLPRSAPRKDDLLLAAGSQGHFRDQGRREGSVARRLPSLRTQ